ncbi:hypothetical protein [Seonamhaeicola marinus]|uniref:Uncharacterized protein n=1 Tax=Seonamhaeicola marinus TaxID=1912246 RepID=A0A5D0HL84_9FLAO|nr:hypothetical protein [Seonamhaeicola marinus]TYA70062.1 hypothetical protein FUA24_22520 [Seonamhaeicola marinus]
MKKTVYYLGGLCLLALLIFIGYQGLMAAVIQDTTAEKCNVETRKIVAISEGSSFDLIFKDAQGDRYYINRGLERGLNLDSLNAKVLNKTVTLHLAKIFGGRITSEHISQLEVDDTIIFTEFK